MINWYLSNCFECPTSTILILLERANKIILYDLSTIPLFLLWCVRHTQLNSLLSNLYGIVIILLIIHCPDSISKCKVAMKYLLICMATNITHFIGFRFFNEISLYLDNTSNTLRTRAPLTPQPEKSILYSGEQWCIQGIASWLEHKACVSHVMYLYWQHGLTNFWTCIWCYCYIFICNFLIFIIYHVDHFFKKRIKTLIEEIIML